MLVALAVISVASVAGLIGLTLWLRFLLDRLGQVGPG